MYTSICICTKSKAVNVFCTESVLTNLCENELLQQGIIILKLGKMMIGT